MTPRQAERLLHEALKGKGRSSERRPYLTMDTMRHCDLIPRWVDDMQANGVLAGINDEAVLVQTYLYDSWEYVS